MFIEAIEHIYLFLERGGDVLYGLMLIIFLLWVYVFERCAYLGFVHKNVLNNAIVEWEARKERKSWSAHQIRQDLISTVESGLENNMTTIKMLVGICPLFGLLGTVTGMIDVFEVMSYAGNAGPKAMAAGISKATIPTMGGMVGALFGILAQSLLQRHIRREKTSLEDKLTFDH